MCLATAVHHRYKTDGSESPGLGKFPEELANFPGPWSFMPELIAPPSEGIASLSPSNLGMVMATGVVSLAADGLGFSQLARALFVINLGLYAVLCVLMTVRAIRHPARFFGDMFDHREGPGYFTAVAATSRDA